MNAPVGQPTVEEEEDVSRGDALDLVTPREISRMRYEQHHEWMEEVVESPYNIYQIIPSDLGLGRKGELESLTRGFFEAPMSGANPTSNGVPARVGKMDAGKAAEFTKLAAQKVAAMQKELEEMKAKHARRMEKLKQTSVLADAEKKLRTANDGGDPGDGEKQESGSSTDDIVRDVEVAWGRKIDRVQNVTVMQRGGVEDPAPRLQSSASARTMSGTSQNRPFGSGSFNQGTPSMEPRQSPMQGQQGFQQHQQPTPHPQSQPQPTPHVTRVAESVATMVFGQQEIPTIASEREPQPTSTATSAAPTSQPESQAGTEADGANGTNASDDIDMAEDINMDGLGDLEEASGDAENQDWVMVDENANQTPEKQQETPQSDSMAPTMPPEQAPLEAPPTPQAPNEQIAPPSVEEPVVAEQPIVDQPANQVTPPLHMEDSGMDPGDLGLGDDFDDVSNMDTAGDALAQYGEGDDLDLDNMDDSAFGDAFHPADD
jgi:hypothetical protein